MVIGVNFPSLRGLGRELGVSHEQVRKWLRVLGYRGYRDWLGATGLAGVDYADYVLRTYTALRRLGVRYSVLPPLAKDLVVPWPWFTVNIFNVGVLGGYIDAYRSIGARIEFVLLDCGVDRYWQRPVDRLPVNREYGDGYWDAFWGAVDKLRSFAREAGFAYEVTVPDYPDDYTERWGRPHALWSEESSDYATNIDKTMRNIFEFLDSDPGQPWLVPVQGYEDVPSSIALALEVLKPLARRYRFGIANVCTTRSSRVILETVRLAREACKECAFHIFGPGLGGVRRLFEGGLLLRGDSWDSFGYTWPRVSGVGKTQDVYERVKWFCIYLKRIYDVLRYAGVLR